LFLFGVSASIVAISPEVRQWGYRMAALAVAIGALIGVIRWQEELALGVLRRVLQPLPARFAEPVDRFFRGFIQALEIMDSPWTFLQVLALSLYLWLVISSVFMWGILAFALPVPLIVGGVVVMVVTAIAVSVPSAPGFIGSFQLGCTLSLAIFHVSQSQAFAYSIVVHITQFVATVAAGLYSLGRGGFTMRQIEAVAESDDAAA